MVIRNKFDLFRFALFFILFHYFTLFLSNICKVRNNCKLNLGQSKRNFFRLFIITVAHSTFFWFRLPIVYFLLQFYLKFCLYFSEFGATSNDFQHREEVITFKNQVPNKISIFSKNLFFVSYFSL